MAYYLQMDGVDDKILAPFPIGTKYIQIKVKRRADSSGYLIDLRNTDVANSVTGYASSTATAGYDQFIVDGITKARANTNVSTDLQQDVLHDVTIRLTAATTVAGVMTMGTRYTGATIGTDWLAFDLYQLSFLDINSSALRSFSFFGSGTTLPGSDGVDATLTGGTWVDEGGTPTGTPGSVPYATKQIIYRSGSVNLATKQTVYQTGSTPNATRQTLYQVGSIIYATQQTISDGGFVGKANYATKQVIYQVTSVTYATKQRVYIAGSVTFTTQQSIMDFAQVISTVDIVGEYDPVLDVYGEMGSVLDITGEIETLSDINGVIGMAIENADITIYRANDKDIRDTVKNKDGTPTNLSGSSINWVLKKRVLDGGSLITKNTPSGIDITDPINGVFVVHLSDSDTDIPQGRYYYASKVTDVLGNTTTVSTGHIVIKP